MKVIGISLPKTAYKPGESVVATVTVQREIESGGVVYFYIRRTGQVWQAGPVVTVGNTGLALPDIFAKGQTQMVNAIFNLPSDASGNYQIGAREQSESAIGVQGVASFVVNPTVPTPNVLQTTVTFVPNRSDVKDAVVYVDGSPVGILAAWGTTVVLTPGKHTVSADGSVFYAESAPVTFLAGSTVKVPITLLPKSSKNMSAGSGITVGANIPTFAIVGVAAVLGLGMIYLMTKRD